METFVKEGRGKDVGVRGKGGIRNFFEGRSPSMTDSQWGAASENGSARVFTKSGGAWRRGEKERLYKKPGQTE